MSSTGGLEGGGGDSLVKLAQDHQIKTDIPDILVDEENVITNVAENIIGEVHEVEVQTLTDRQVVPEQLQQSVQETKTRERRLVFDTLKQKNRDVLASYGDMNKFKQRLGKEINLALPGNPGVTAFLQKFAGYHHPKEVSKDTLAKLLETDFGITPEEAQKIASRVCFVGKKHLGSEMTSFKKNLTSMVIAAREKDGFKMGQKECKDVEKQIKKLNLGEDPKQLSATNLSAILHNQGILRKQSADNVSKEMCEHTKFDQLPLLRSDLKSMHSFKNKLFHNIMNQRAKEGYTPTQDEVKALKQKIDGLDLGENPKKVSSKKLGKILYENGIVRQKLAGDVAKAVCKEYQAGLKDLRDDSMKLAMTARNLNQLLESNPSDKDMKETNKKIISLLREAFDNKAYQALKENEDNPTIHFLHELNLAMYTETPLLDAYVAPIGEEGMLGDKLLQGHEGKKLGEAIQDVRDDAVQNRGLFSSHSCLKYIMNHFEQFFGAFTSQKFGSPLGDYDPHGDLGNNSGALYEEKLDVYGTEGRSIDVRTPSPTVGGKVSAEFRAGLQAIQNQRVSESAGEGGYGRPNCWLYTNYQDITNEWNGEHGRSKAIMKLNEDFPLAFRGITLSKDSEYFKDRLGHGEGAKLWEKVDPNTTFDKDSIPDFIDDMKAKLTDDANFTLENRTKAKGTKLYFPAKDQAEVDEYKRVLGEIANQTGEFMKEVMGNDGFQGKNAWMIKAAAKEFAYAAIQKYLQAKELAALEKQGLKPEVITTSACKEDIDRGFSDHVKRMYMLGAGDEAFLAKIVNLPALMARYRVILNDRIQPLIGVVNYVDRNVAKDHLDEVTAGLSVSSLSAVPFSKV